MFLVAEFQKSRYNHGSWDEACDSCKSLGDGARETIHEEILHQWQSVKSSNRGCRVR